MGQERPYEGLCAMAGEQSDPSALFDLILPPLWLHLMVNRAGYEKAPRPQKQGDAQPALPFTLLGANWLSERDIAMKRKKRVLVLTGAGASLEFGAPSTAKLTEAIETRVCADAWMQQCGGDHAYLEISKTLAGYLQGGAEAVNFERVYHCAHELLSTFKPIPRAMNEYRPLLVPFVTRRIAVDEQALRALVESMAKFIFEELSAVCNKPEASLDPLTSFLAKLREDHITRIYTTNYDDFLLQATPDLYTGFDSAPSPGPKSFDSRAFWQATDADSVFHLHGSVHLGFDIPQKRDVDLDALYWFDDRAKALPHASYGGSGKRQMDGSQIMPTAVITGFDKLPRLQQPPLSHYYASMARDALTADIIYVIGSGLGDLHLNTWVGDARRTNPKPPLIFVDYWPEGFLESTAFRSGRKTMDMLHQLRMRVNHDYYGGDLYGNGWTLEKERTCAIWDKGFLSFLRAPSELDDVLAELTGLYA